MPPVNPSDYIVLKKADGLISDIRLSLPNLRNAVSTCRAINHRLRRQIMLLLEEKPGRSVTGICAALRLEQAVASQHLAILRKAEIVRTSRDGRMIRYALDKSRIRDINVLLPRLAVSDAPSHK